MVKEETMYLRDPVHGFIRVSPLENRVINTKFFWRLSFIKQLGFTSYVYHGADHTRFAHSMGVMHLTEKILDYLGRNYPESEPLTNYEVEKLRLAALLHDIGHPPLSHSLEEALKDEDVYGENAKHENYTKTIINDTWIEEILKSKSYDPKQIADLILGESKEFFNQLISGEIDADRMDYLLRDSKYCGVAYGIYDLDRLLVMLRRHKDSIMIHRQGLEAIELFLLARLYMYIQVYNHAPIKGYDLIACKVFKELMKMDLIYYPPPEPDEIQEIIDCDDIWFFSELRRIRLRVDESLRKLIDMILYRKSLRMVKEEKEWIEINPEENNGEKRYEEKVKAIKEDIMSLKDNVIKRLGLKEECFFTHFPKQELSKYKPYIEYDAIEAGKQIKILDEENNVGNILEEKASILPKLASMKLVVGRLYTFPEFENKVRKEIKSLERQS